MAHGPSIKVLIGYNLGHPSHLTRAEECHQKVQSETEMRYDEACRILQVPIGATDDAVHAAWRKQIKRLHPDRNKGRGLYEQATQELNEARKVAVEMRPTHMRKSSPVSSHRTGQRVARVRVDWESELAGARRAAPGRSVADQTRNRQARRRVSPDGGAKFKLLWLLLPIVLTAIGAGLVWLSYGAPS